MIILSHYKLLINTELLTAFLPILGAKAAMWVKSLFKDSFHVFNAPRDFFCSI